MEHRSTERKPVRMAVMLSCPRIGLVRGHASNIGMGGMFIETPCAVMPKYAPITVSFQPSADDGLVCFQVRGMVVRQGAEGFGLMFDDLQPACRASLHKLIRRHAEPASAETTTEQAVGA